MIDISNRSEEEINGIIKKFESVLEYVKNKEVIPVFAIIIDIATKHLIDNYKELNSDWKSFTMMYIKYKFNQSKINSEADVIKFVDEFVKYYKEDYPAFLEDVEMSTSDFDRDLCFLLKYI